NRVMPESIDVAGEGGGAGGEVSGRAQERHIPSVRADDRIRTVARRGIGAVGAHTDQENGTGLQVFAVNVEVGGGRSRGQIGRRAGKSHVPAIGADDRAVTVATQGRAAIRTGADKGELAGPEVFEKNVVTAVGVIRQQITRGTFK